MPLAHSEIRFSVAPMMERTDRHCRYLHRLMSKRTRLYTEMVVAQALHFGRDVERWLAFDAAEHPIAFQLGGSDPKILASAARKVAAAGYDEINLNAGCPSDRVSSGRFGACLMAEPKLIAECIAAMKDAVDLPVTLKTRIGIDDDTGDGRLDDVAGRALDAGCSAFVIHARNAILKGLSPKENREIPPLRYDRVYRLKASFPDVPVVINGGLKTVDDAIFQLAHVDGAMIGRAAYERPFDILARVDSTIFGDQFLPAEHAVAAQYIDYAERQISSGVRPQAVLRHAVNLFRDRAGARQWRQSAAQGASEPGATIRLRRLLD